MQFLVDTLKSQGFLQEKESLNDITSDFVCDFKSKECMFGECDICADKKNQLVMIRKKLKLNGLSGL